MATIFTNPFGKNAISSGSKDWPAQRVGNYFGGYKGTGGLIDPNFDNKPSKNEEKRDRATFEILGYESAEGMAPFSNPAQKSDPKVIASREKQAALEQARKNIEAEKAEKARLEQEEADKAKAEQDKKAQEEENKKKAEREKAEKDRALFEARKKAEQEDKTLANRVATEAFGGTAEEASQGRGQPDDTSNPNARRVSPKSFDQRRFEITRRLLFNAAQERRREMNQ